MTNYPIIVEISQITHQKLREVILGGKLLEKCPKYCRVWKLGDAYVADTRQGEEPTWTLPFSPDHFLVIVCEGGKGPCMPPEENYEDQPYGISIFLFFFFCVGILGLVLWSTVLSQFLNSYPSILKQVYQILINHQ